MFMPKSHGRRLSPGQRSELRVFDIGTGDSRLILATDHLIEAPNWTPDGKDLIVNAGGQLWSLPLDDTDPEPRLIPTGPLDTLNNDHVVSPDGRLLYVSADDGHLWRVPRDGGEPVRISNIHSTPFHYYLHGISPDGQELAYVALEGEGAARRANIFTIPASGGPDRRLTDFDRPSDGPEYTPDGTRILFNSEHGAADPGHAQIFSMDRSGSDIRQLTDDARVNWFPHVSPDGLSIVYLSYPPGTLGHPADKEVILRLMPAGGGPPRDLVPLFGGQGTINVNSWSPDSRQFAYVAYPLGVRDVSGPE